eukprot:190652-Chlamydomonas_euryale.AAC.3
MRGVQVWQCEDKAWECVLRQGSVLSGLSAARAQCCQGSVLPGLSAARAKAMRTALVLPGLRPSIETLELAV